MQILSSFQIVKVMGSSRIDKYRLEIDKSSLGYLNLGICIYLQNTKFWPKNKLKGMSDVEMTAFKIRR
jgi:hypothetical protein